MKQATHASTMLKLVGDHRVLTIVRALDDRELRFCELQREAGDMNPVTFTSRLKQLEAAGLLERRVDTDQSMVTYQLSKRGKRLVPVAEQLHELATELPN